MNYYWLLLCLPFVEFSCARPTVQPPIASSDVHVDVKPQKSIDKGPESSDEPTHDDTAIAPSRPAQGLLVAPIGLTAGHVATGPPIRRNHQVTQTSALIRRVLRRSVTKLQQCYKLEPLNSVITPIELGFTIDNSGSVSSAIATGLGAATATCIKETLRSLHFPLPPGGGSVRVRYPMH